VLGLTEGAAFDEVLAAKDRLSGSGDREQLQRVITSLAALPWSALASPTADSSSDTPATFRTCRVYVRHAANRDNQALCRDR
jgi:hypothetical protein